NSCISSWIKPRAEKRPPQSRALCSLLFALRSLLFALCSLLFALCSSLFALRSWLLVFGFWARRYRLRKNSGFVSGYRFSDTVSPTRSDAPLGAGHRESTSFPPPRGQ